MAEKKQRTIDAYNEIMASLSKGQVAPVYLLMGEESYYIDKISEYISEHILTNEEKDFNLNIVYGSDVNAQRIIDEARRFPVMADHQVLVVREAQNVKDLEKLESYMEKPVKSTVLVICYKGGVIDSRKKIVQRATNAGVLFISSPAKYDSEIIEFIKSYISSPSYNAKIEQRALQVLAAHIGGDLKRMASELDKLLLSLEYDKSRVITPDIIEQRIGISKSYNVFELRDALINRDALKAQQIVKYYNNNPKSGGLFAVLPMLFSFFQNLMLAYYTPKPVSESAIMSQLSLKTPWAVKDYIRAMRNFTPRKTLDIITKIREIDARSKGLDNVSTPPEELLKELITYIVQ